MEFSPLKKPPEPLIRFEGFLIGYILAIGGKNDYCIYILPNLIQNVNV